MCRAYPAESYGTRSVPTTFRRVSGGQSPHGRQTQSVGATRISVGRSSRPGAAADLGPLAGDRDSDGLHWTESLSPPVASLRGRHRDARLRVFRNRHGMGLFRLPLGVRVVHGPRWLAGGSTRGEGSARLCPAWGLRCWWRQRGRVATFFRVWRLPRCSSCGS